MKIIILFLLFCVPIFGSEKQRITFIVNPISHEIKGKDLPKIIEKNINLNKFEYKIVYSEYAGHATELAYAALRDSADIVAAVGGDGTVNEVGKALIYSNAALAIIPVGSGNGLARHFKIPVGLPQAIRALNEAYPIAMDTGKLNNQTFLAVAGVGFDAHIAEQFAQFGKRGLFSYCQVCLREFSKYKPQTFLMTIDGKQFVKKAFVLTFANASQFGNDFTIAPKAEIADGFLDMVIINELPVHAIPKFLYKFKHNTLDSSEYFETIRFKELTIYNTHVQVHLDGEPMVISQDINLSVQPKSLKVLVPKFYL